MPARGIRDGDKVRIFVNKDSWTPAIEGGIGGVWTVEYTPCDVGDTWRFERDGQIIVIHSCSANFDGLELVGRADDP